MYKHWDNQRKCLIEAISKAQSVLCQVCAGTNYAIFFRNLHSDLLLKKNIIPVYVDLAFLSAVSEEAFFKLVLSSLKRALLEKKLISKADMSESGLTEIKDSILNLTSDFSQRGFTVTFFLEDFDLVLEKADVFISYFEELKNTSPKCSFIYLLKVNMSHPANRETFSRYSHVYENVIYFPIRDEATLRSVEKGTSINIFKAIYELTGGVDSFVGVAMDLKNNLAPKERRNIRRYLIDNQHLRREVNKLWENLSPFEIVALAQIVWGYKELKSELKPSLEHLLNLGLVRKSKKGYEISVGLIRHVGVDKFNSHILRVECSRDSLLVNGNKVSLKLTQIEKRVLRQLLSNKNRIVGKNALAKSIWNGSHERRYDERVINDTVKLIRNKLSDVWIDPKNLIPVEGKGYIYIEK